MDKVVNDLFQDKQIGSIIATDLCSAGEPFEIAKNKIVEYIQGQVQKIIFIECEEDIVLTEKERYKLPFRVKFNIQYSLEKGIRFYYLCLPEDKKKLAVGTFGSGCGKLNDKYFGEIIKNPKIQEKLITYKTKLSEILQQK